MEETEKDIDESQGELDALTAKCALEENSGPVASELDKILQECGVERQAYYGRTFVGNHCHKMLKVSILTAQLQ